MFELLREKINPEMTREEIDKLFDSDEKENINQLKELIQKIHSGTSQEDVINLIQEECEVNNLVDYLVGLIEEENRPFEETRFLREMDYDRFRIVVDYIFQNVFLSSESKEIVMKRSELSDDKVQIVIKLINTMMQYTIVRRFTRDNFAVSMERIFGLDNERIEFLWNLYIDNREDLRSLFFMRRIYELSDIKQEIDNLLETILLINDKIDALQ